MNTLPAPALRSVRFRPFLSPRTRPGQPRPIQFTRRQRITLLTGVGVCFDYLLLVLYLFVLTSTVLTAILLHQQFATAITRRLHNATQVVSWSQTH